MSVATPTPPVTQAPPTVVALPTAPAAVPWSTPKRLRAAVAAVCFAAFLLSLAVFFGAQQHAAAVKTIGQSSAPSIVAAEKIKAALSDMDANVANELIAKPSQDKKSVTIKGYDDRRGQLSDGLVAAAQNITYGESERAPIQAMNFDLGTYEADVAQARLLHGRGGDRAVLTTYSDANTLMQGSILPAADALDTVNDKHLENAYASQKAMSGVTLTAVWATGLLLLAVLVGAQVFLSRSTNRVFNLPLLAATGLTVLFLLFTSAKLGDASRDLKAAKEDAFDSVYALWHARAIAFDANANESRWLIDRAHAGNYQNAFNEESGKIATLPPGMSYGDVAAKCQAKDVKDVPPSFTGFLANELRNITFPGEQEAADETLIAWGKYVGIDSDIRSLQNAGRHADAVALCTGMGPEQSNGAYKAFDDALGRTLDINQKEFDKDVARGSADTAALPVLAPLAMLAVALLAWLGIRPRLREYGL